MSPAAPLRDIIYRLRQGAGGHFPGAHRSRHGDCGMEFRSHRPLMSGGDPRRLDVQASLRDPLGGWWARLHAERTSVPVVLVADLSASMGFVGRQSRREVLADLTDSLAWSAQRGGDAFGFVGAATDLPSHWQLPPTRQRGAGRVLAQALRSHAFDEVSGRSAQGMKGVPGWLPKQRSLVFLVSDSHWSESLLNEVLEGLARHEVVPVVIWDRAEYELPRRNGLAWLRDAEGAGEHLIWVRPSLRRRSADRLAQAQRQLEARMQRHHLRPLYLLDGFDVDRVNAHFHG